MVSCVCVCVYVRLCVFLGGSGYCVGCNETGQHPLSQLRNVLAREYACGMQDAFRYGVDSLRLHSQSSVWSGECR